jgi:hypothetical protein
MGGFLWHLQNAGVLRFAQDDGEKQTTATATATATTTATAKATAQQRLRVFCSLFSNL